MICEWCVCVDEFEVVVDLFVVFEWFFVDGLDVYD